MTNIYKEFFQEIKYFIIELGIDAETPIEGCDEKDIQDIEDKVGKLPLAYKEYLSNIGKNFLFEFFDGEQLAYKDFEDINEYAAEAINETGFVFDQNFFPISHRRYEYFRFFYLEENDDPEIWVFQENDDDDDLSTVRTTKRNFTTTIIIFFRRILMNKTAGFHWVTDEEEKENENIVEDRYFKWFKNLVKLKHHINANKSANKLVNEIHQAFLDYYLPEEQDVIDEIERITTERKQNYLQEKAKKSFWKIIKNLFR